MGAVKTKAATSSTPQVQEVTEGAAQLAYG